MGKEQGRNAEEVNSVSSQEGSDCQAQEQRFSLLGSCQEHRIQGITAGELFIHYRALGGNPQEASPPQTPSKLWADA